MESARCAGVERGEGLEMKFKQMQSDLQKALHVVASVVPSKSTLPILETVLIDASPEGRLTLTATDLDISVRTQSSAEVSEAGKIAVSARRLFDIVRELPEQEITLSGSETHLELTGARGRYRFVGAPVEDFPELPDISTDKQVTFAPLKLEQMIRRTLYAVSTDETRPELTGVYLEIAPKQEEVRMVATNGHRLARASLKGDFKQERDMLLPPKALNQVLRLLSEVEGEVEVSGSKSYARFGLGNTSLYSRLLEGPFPEYDRVIPKTSSRQAILNRSDFVASLRRILVLSDSQTRQVRMAFSKGHLQLLSEYQGAGEASEEMPAEYDGDEVTIGYNGGYLLEMFKTFQGEKVVMTFESAVSAGVFKPVAESEDEDLLCLVMPLRLPEGR
jgi:DNA polymerase-3 subunit beta